MDRVEAAEILRGEMTAYARRSRADLVPLIGETEAYEIKGPSKVSYQVEVNVLWDEKSGGTIRVVGGIDDGGFRTSFSPLTDGFLVQVDGTVDMPDRGAPA